MAVELSLVNHIVFFSNLPRPLMERIAFFATEHTFESRQILFEQGSAPAGLYIIKQGFVMLYREANKQMQILALPISGECFGIESFSGNLSSPYSVKTLTYVEVIYWSVESLNSLIKDYPRFQVTLLDLISSRAKEFVALVHNLAFRDVTARLATVLINRAEREGKSTAEGIVINRLLTQQELAAIIGTVREVIYRTFKKFEKQGIARLTRKQIIIYDIDQLIQISSQENR